MANLTNVELTPDRVLAKATVRLARRLAIRPRVMCQILGISPRDWKRVKAGTRVLARQTPVGRRALQLIEIYLGLFGILGTDAQVRRWLRARVTPLKGTPLALMQRRRGFEHVLHYVSDAVSR